MAKNPPTKSEWRVSGAQNPPWTLVLKLFLRSFGPRLILRWRGTHKEGTQPRHSKSPKFHEAAQQSLQPRFQGQSLKTSCLQPMSPALPCHARPAALPRERRQEQAWDSSLERRRTPYCLLSLRKSFHMLVPEKQREVLLSGMIPVQRLHTRV